MATAAVDFTQAYNVLAQARDRLFGWIRPLTQAQYTHSFPFGSRTLRATLIEIARVEWMYTVRMRGELIPPLAEWPINEDRQPTFADLEAVWKDQAERTRATFNAVTDWQAPSERRIVRPGQPTLVRTASLAQIALQMLLHETHHRAQAMAMLRQLGVEAQNLDYLTFAAASREEPA